MQKLLEFKQMALIKFGKLNTLFPTILQCDKIQHLYF